jgi:aspartate/methionine/tyrosine aminotransferase
MGGNAMLQLVPNPRLGTETAFPRAAAPPASSASGVIINLGIGQPDFKTPQHIVEAAIGAARRSSRLHAGPGHPARARVGGQTEASHDVEVSLTTSPSAGRQATMFFSS